MKMLIGGRWMEAKNGKTMAVHNPATGKFLDTVPEAASEDMELALENAAKGQQQWAGTPMSERRQIIRKYIHLLEKQKTELITLCVRECGRDIPDTVVEYNQMIACLTERLQYLEQQSEKAPGIMVITIPSDSPMEVYGDKVPAALQEGNAVIVRPSAENPLTSIRLTELLLQAGIPGNVLQVITGTDIFRMPNRAGVYWDDEIKERSSHSFVAFSGADPAEAAVLAWNLRKRNAGQNRNSPKKFIIHNSIRKEFIFRLVDLVREIEVDYKDDIEKLLETYFLQKISANTAGNYMGSLISENAAERVEKQVCHAVRQGAVLLCGGGRTGAFYMPAVLDHITGKMDIARHMVIDGPVWPVIGFDTAEDAMVMARFEEKKSRINYEWRMERGIMWDTGTDRIC